MRGTIDCHIILPVPGQYSRAQPLCRSAALPCSCSALLFSALLSLLRICSSPPAGQLLSRRTLLVYRTLEESTPIHRQPQMLLKELVFRGPSSSVFTNFPPSISSVILGLRVLIRLRGQSGSALGILTVVIQQGASQQVAFHLSPVWSACRIEARDELALVLSNVD